MTAPAPIKEATPITAVPNAPVPGTAAPQGPTGQRTPTNFQTPTTAPTRAPAHASSGATGETAVIEEDDSSPNLVAGIWAAAGAVLTIIGSMLTWAVDTGNVLPGVDPIDISFSGLQSNARNAIVLAVIMLICGFLLYRGKRPGVVYGVTAIVCGAGILAMVFYGYVDITGRASRTWAAEVALDAGLPGQTVIDAGIGLKPAFGLWITALGGFVGAMTGPFIRRDADAEVDGSV